MGDSRGSAFGSITDTVPHLPTQSLSVGSQSQHQDSAARSASAQSSQHSLEPPRPPPPARSRRVLFEDRRFQDAGLEGLHSREFEVDLLHGERIHGDPIRVRLKRSVSFWRQLFFTVITFGIYFVWVRCCAFGSQVFDVDARLALTTHGRLLLWTHSAAGGGKPFLQHCFAAVQRPAGFGTIVFGIVFFAFGPLILNIAMVEASIVVVTLLSIAFITHVFGWLLERASLQAKTSVRQFDACDVSCVRLLCYSYRSLWGLRGEVTSCHCHMFFGPYPKPVEIARVMPWSAWDSGSVTPSPILGGVTSLGEN